MITIIDHFDSFTNLLADQFRVAGQKVQIISYGDLSLTVDMGDILVLSPGPGQPKDYPKSLALLKKAWATHPIFGVCLGMQLITESFGGQTESARALLHGKVSAVQHQSESIFRGLPDGFMAARYHSLAVKEPLPDELEVIARSPDDEIMGLMHESLPIYAVQFHPESFMTEFGAKIITNFLELAQ